jgi:hypothetical protein
VLSLDIGGFIPGMRHDQLNDIGQLNFGGRLHLVFADGFAPGNGGWLSLFNFEQFSGRLSADVIDVVGFDVAQLDFSRLATTGELGVMAPVPEPGTWLRSMVGLGLLSWRMRWARR